MRRLARTVAPVAVAADEGRLALHREIEVWRIVKRGQYVPGRGYDKNNQGAAERMNLLPGFAEKELPRDRQIDQPGSDGENRGNEALQQQARDATSAITFRGQKGQFRAGGAVGILQGIAPTPYQRLALAGDRLADGPPIPPEGREAVAISALSALRCALSCSVSVISARRRASSSRTWTAMVAGKRSCWVRRTASSCSSERR